MDSLENAIMIERDVWLSSYLSVAKYYGGISLNGHEYYVLGRAQDLVRDDWKGVYNRLGRDKVIELLKNNVSLSEAKKIKKEKKKNDEQKLF
jgi:hypothetical protein